MALEIKEKKPRKPIMRPATIEDYQTCINNAYDEISKIQKRIEKYETKIKEMKKQEILDKIVNSGKSLEEILEMINQ